MKYLICLAASIITIVLVAQNVNPPGSDYAFYCDYQSVDTNGNTTFVRLEWNSSNPNDPWANPTSFQFCDIPSFGTPPGGGSNCRSHIVEEGETYRMDQWQVRCGLIPNPN
jgi:hypothetical protein